MTVQELFDRTLSLINEEPTQYAGILIGCVNRLLADTFRLNNFVLKYRQTPELTVIPTVSSASDEIPYYGELVSAAFPYGLASLLIYDDEDLNKVMFWKAQFADALDGVKRIFEERVVDVYDDQGKCIGEWRAFL